MKSPKLKRLTPFQEEQLTKSERLNARAEIFEKGVAEFLKQGEWCGTDATFEASSVLAEAAELRNRARAIRRDADL